MDEGGCGKHGGRAGMIDASVHQQLGTLIAEVKNLREDFRRSEDKSDASRASMHRRWMSGWSGSERSKDR
jgi:hypothetical protein